MCRAAKTKELSHYYILYIELYAPHYINFINASNSRCFIISIFDYASCLMFLLLQNLFYTSLSMDSHFMKVIICLTMHLVLCIHFMHLILWISLYLSHSMNLIQCISLYVSHSMHHIPSITFFASYSAHFIPFWKV